MSEHERAMPRYPFKRSFDIGEDRPRFLGLPLDEVEDLAHAEGLATRVLELPITGRVAWHADRRSDRLNLVVADGVVVGAAVF